MGVLLPSRKGVTFYGCQGASPSHYDPPTSLFGSVRRVGGDGDERLSPRVCPSMNVGSVLCAPVIVGYEWVRDSVEVQVHLDIEVSVTMLQC